MYVNELTRDYGDVGRRAVEELLRRAGTGVVAEYVARVAERMRRVDRVLDRLEQLYAISPTRVGDSPEEDAAHALAARWMREAGLEVEVDARRQHASGAAATRASGSARTSTPSRTAAASTARSASSPGSSWPSAPTCRSPSSRSATRSAAAPAAARASPPGSLPDAYLELHVEQGPVLERAGEPLGIVTAIAGQARGEVVFEGRADHAGTTPMDARDDALVEAAEFVLHVRDAPRAGTVATVGRLDVEPGAVNVVPARVTVSVEARAGDRPRARRARRRDRLRAELPSPSPRDERRRRSTRCAPPPRTRPSSSPAPATTRRSSPPPASRPGCSSSAA